MTTNPRQASSPFDTLLGTGVETASADKVITHTRIRPELLQPHGIVHGGVLATLAETAASMGAGRASRTGVAVGQSNHTEFLKPATPQSEILTATAIPVNRGRQVQVWEVSITDKHGTEIARSIVRLFNVRPPESSPSH